MRFWLDYINVLVSLESRQILSRKRISTVHMSNLDTTVSYIPKVIELRDQLVAIQTEVED